MNGQLARTAERLRRWDRWRKGTGEYKYKGRPEGYRPIPSPEDPKDLGDLIETAADLVDALARWDETGDAGTLREAILKLGKKP